MNITYVLALVDLVLVWLFVLMYDTWSLVHMVLMGFSGLGLERYLVVLNINFVSLGSIYP